MRKEKQEPATYDRLFLSGGSEGIYRLPYRKSPYYPLFVKVARVLKRSLRRHVLEVGCGTGTLAEMLFRRSVNYHGFDFSTVAVSSASARTGKSERFYVADATAEESYRRYDYDAIVCCEVLEHIPSDIEVISLWKPGTYCICSVPNFDDPTHERLFETKQDVASRYGHLIDIEGIQCIARPLLHDMGLGNRIRHLIWNRRNWKRCWWLLFGPPFSEGGWFLFFGTRRDSGSATSV